MKNKINLSNLNTDNNNITTAVTEVLYSSSDSAVSWPAIIAGALIAAATSLILLLLGSGLGLATVSPWSNVGITAATFTIATIVWVIVVQCISSSLGGYLTGRMRRKWENVPQDEAYFLDTAHGLLSWALATVITAVLLTSAITSIVSGSTKAVTTVAAAGAVGAGYAAQENSNPAEEESNYFIDRIFRSGNGNGNVSESDMRIEATRILTLGMSEGELTASDRSFLAQTIAMRTGVSLEEANQRIDNVIVTLNAAKEKAKQGADIARKAGMKGTLYMFLSLLIGAFVASYFAAYGGRHRDSY